MTYYALFFISSGIPNLSIVTTTATGLIIAVIEKVLVLVRGKTEIYMVSIALMNEFWFVLRMGIYVLNVRKRKE